MLKERWAKEDFATLFQYFWHRDFPVYTNILGARPVDFTMHINLIVHYIADLMGLVARFERGGRKDAVLRSVEGDEIAIEWEWEDILGEDGKLKGNELRKLQKHKVWRPNDQEGLKYAVLITYTRDAEEVYERVRGKWEGVWPLLLILVDFVDVPKRTLSTGREFKNMHISVFHNGEHARLWTVPALPWEVPETRWSSELR